MYITEAGRGEMPKAWKSRGSRKSPERSAHMCACVCDCVCVCGWEAMVTNLPWGPMMGLASHACTLKISTKYH